MRVEGHSEIAKGKNRKTKKSPTKRLKIQQNKYSQEFKARNKERLNKWKVSIVYDIILRKSTKMIRRGCMR